MKYLFNSFVLDLDRGEFRDTEGPVPVEPRVFALLGYLFGNPGRLVDRDTLIETVWDGRIVSDAAISTAVKAARRAIGDNGSKPAWLKTIRGQGFRFDGEVRVADREPAELDAPVVQAGEVQTNAPEGAAQLFFDRPSLLVMGFIPASHDEEDLSFATGLAVDLRTSLAMWRWFPVIGPEAIGWRNERDGNLREIAQDVRAAYVISGMIRRSGQKIRVTASLSETASGHIVWSENFDGELSDVFQMQEDIGRAVVARIFPEIGKAEAARIKGQRPSDMAAWQLMARVDEIERTGGAGYGTPESNHVQRELLEKAVEREPSYARAWARLGRYWYRSAMQGWLTDRESGFEKALECAQRAITEDPLDWEGHSYRALSLIFGAHAFGPGRFHAEEGVRLNPSAPLARHAIGCALEWLGDIDEAIHQKEILFALNPNYPASAAVLGELATCQMLKGDLESAAVTARRLHDIAPDYSRGLQRVVSVLASSGAETEAGEVLSRVMELQPDFGEAYVRATYPYLNPEHLEVFLEGLFRAGMPRGT